MFRWIFACVVMVCLALPAGAEELETEVIQRYDSPTLRYTIEQLEYESVTCFATRVWMAEPGRQIRKATALWEENLMYPYDMAQSVEGAALVINGSGYVSPIFPEIPDNYPGDSPDYYYTPLGSLTITDGEVFRNLPGVPYYGLTLQQDGLHLHVGEDNEEILAAQPTQTWSFYEGCPLILDHTSILDETWRFAQARAIRTIIACLGENDYLLLTVTNRPRAGLSLIQCVELLTEHFDPVWAYDLDGGPSSALIYRLRGADRLQVLFGNMSMDADIMAFVE